MASGLSGAESGGDGLSRRLDPWCGPKIGGRLWCERGRPSGIRRSGNPSFLGPDPHGITLGRDVSGGMCPTHTGLLSGVCVEQAQHFVDLQELS
jgi:hypothetical protein